MYIYFISICLLITILLTCDQMDNKLDNITTQDNKNYVSIILEGRTYVTFCAIDNNKKGV